jgi:Flp pilus assembly pilin Flp
MSVYLSGLDLFGTDREEGQGMAEYALIIALVAVVLIAGLGLLAGQDADSGIRGVFTRIVAAFT